MGARDAYPAGTFSWVDLATPEADAAKRFYRALLGWDAPAGPAYAHCSLGGRDVAGIYTRATSSAGTVRAGDGAPQWTSYVAVDDADAVAARAAELGGGVVEPPFDVGDEGRRAVLADPAGARVALWQAGTHPGARLVNDLGCWCSNQLQAPDPAVAVPFYRALLGWEIEQEPGSAPQYWAVRNDGRDNGGMLANEGPPAWVVYFHVADADATAREATAAGGSVHFPPTTVGIGRIAVLADPQGAAFGVFAGRTDP